MEDGRAVSAKYDMTATRKTDTGNGAYFRSAVCAAAVWQKPTSHAPLSSMRRGRTCVRACVCVLLVAECAVFAGESAVPPTTCLVDRQKPATRLAS